MSFAKSFAARVLSAASAQQTAPAPQVAPVAQAAPAIPGTAAPVIPGMAPSVPVAPQATVTLEAIRAVVASAYPTLNAGQHDAITTNIARLTGLPVTGAPPKNLGGYAAAAAFVLKSIPGGLELLQAQEKKGLGKRVTDFHTGVTVWKQADVLRHDAETGLVVQGKEGNAYRSVTFTDGRDKSGQTLRKALVSALAPKGAVETLLAALCLARSFGITDEMIQELVTRSAAIMSK